MELILINLKGTPEEVIKTLSASVLGDIVGKFAVPPAFNPLSEEAIYRNRENGNEKSEERKEKSEAHCHTCGKLFQKRVKDQKFCSESCYQIEYREKNKENQRKYAKEWYQRKKGKNVAAINNDSDKIIADNAKNIADNAKTAVRVDVESFNKKMKEIRQSCPAPTKRPEYIPTIQI